jgi:hypothetical protein
MISVLIEVVHEVVAYHKFLLQVVAIEVVLARVLLVSVLRKT